MKFKNVVDAVGYERNWQDDKLNKKTSIFCWHFYRKLKNYNFRILNKLCYIWDKCMGFFI